MKYAIAVFDIGKTNKKILIYSDELEELTSSYLSFPSRNILRSDIDAFLRKEKLEDIDPNSLPPTHEYIEVEDSHAIEDWIVSSLKKYSESYPIKAIAFSTHGATFASIGKNGKLSFPVLSYTYEPGEEFHQRFFELVGDAEKLQVETATAQFGALLNVAQGIYLIKEQFPKHFENTNYFLLYPQYLGYLLTGEIAADYTYAGCHSYLWDFEKHTWSSVSDKLGVSEKLPKRIIHPYSVLGKIKAKIAEATGLPADVIVTGGIHDSNASLLPYLIREEGKDFILNSTGSWCVIMHPMERVFFEKEEIGKVVFYNMSAFGQPVKTAIFTGGLEHDAYMDIIKKLNRIDYFPEFDLKTYNEVLREKRLFILPTLLKGSGQFPDSPPRVIEGEETYSFEEITNGKRIPHFFNNPKLARAVLNISLAIQTRVAFERTGAERVSTIYTEGGFRKNEGYNALISSFYEETEFMLSNMKEATAFGTALTAKAAYENIDIKELGSYLEIETKEVKKTNFEALEEYTEKYLKYLK